MIYFILAIIAGLALLVWSADRFVEGSVGMARNLGMSPMMIGLTVVAFGTSAPEILVSATAAVTGAPDMAVGNALGSNIANIGLVLGVTALISPLPLKRIVLKREFPVLLIATLVAYGLLRDQQLDRLDGLIFFALMGLALFALSRGTEGAAELIDEVREQPVRSLSQDILWFAASLALLIASSRLLVWGASGIALELGVSDLIIGLTIVAIGTSLPELAACVASALKGHHDVALGNIIGSNLFNLLVVLAIPALVAPMPLEEEVLIRDYATMTLLTVTLALFAYIMWKKGKLARFEGGILLAIYLAYTLLIYSAAKYGTSIKALLSTSPFA
ncbi:calcium/sodium antiporter [Marinobacteraceae bacterium S3BR75-40.1]